MTDEQKMPDKIGGLFDSPIYLKSTPFYMRLLRFLNLLEPDRAVISITKLMMWSMAVFLVVTMIYNSDNIVAIVGAISAFSGTLLNYHLKRLSGNKD